MNSVPEVAAATPRWDPIPYELRIGVTGHRELPNAAAVEAQVQSLLKTVVETLEKASADPLGPHGSPRSPVDRLDRGLSHVLSLITRVIGPLLDLPAAVVSKTWRWPRVPVSPAHPTEAQQTPLKLTVISCLAKGADQIVARVACQMVEAKGAPRNRYLEAVLPFSVGHYEAGFDDAADLKEFRRLLALDRGAGNLWPEPTVLYANVDVSDPANQVSREGAYAAAGRHMVSTSEVVVAIWDPTREEHAGGTAETVRYAIAQGRTVLWINPAKLEAGPALLRFLSSGPRATSAPDAEFGPRALITWAWQRLWRWRRPPVPTEVAVFTSRGHQFEVHPVPGRAKLLSRNFHRLAAYNRDAIIHLEDVRAQWRDKAGDLRELFKKHHLPVEATAAIVDVLLPHYVRADHAASRYRALRDFAARVWPVAAAFVVSLMAIQIIFFPRYYRLALFELAVLVLGSASYRVSLHDAWHSKWLNDRRLAGGLQSAIFSSLLPRDEEDLLERSRTPAASATPAGIRNPLPFYSPATAWFVDSLKRMIAKERRRFAKVLTLENAEQRGNVAGLLREAWVLDQQAHHEKKAGVHEGMASRGQWVRLGMIAVLIGAAIAHAVGVGHATEHDVFRWDLVIGFATVALPAWAAAFHVMLSLDDHERLAERSVQMAHLLEGLADQFEHVQTLDQLRATVKEAERVMDFEAAEWAESLSGRRPEFTG